MKILLLILLLVSVAVNVALYQTISVDLRHDTSLQVYKDSFVQQAAERGVKLPNRKVDIYFGVRAGENTYKPRATTIKRWGGYLKNDIIVDVDWFRSCADQLQIEKTLFHELGHVYLDRYHDNRFVYKDRQLIPVSIMNRLNTDYYVKNRKYYLDELFLGYR